MGLDLTHRKNKGGTLAASYHGFAGFRRELCRVAGYGDLNAYRGFDRARGAKAPRCPHPNTDYVWALLDHSDCEGYIASKRYLRGIAVRLRELSPKLDGWYVGYADRLADLCDECAKLGVPLEFK